MAMAPDGRVFYNELLTGNVRIVDIVSGAWRLRPTPFYHVDVGQGVDQGLLGIVLDPNFTTNQYVYIYYVTRDGKKNWLIRLKEVNGEGTEETLILDTLLANIEVINELHSRLRSRSRTWVTISLVISETSTFNSSIVPKTPSSLDAFHS